MIRGDIAMDSRTLVPISRESLDAHGIPFCPATWRKWHYLKKFPGVIIKIAGRLFIDLEKWMAVVEEATVTEKRGTQI
jgi:hypothetical protein